MDFSFEQGFFITNNKGSYRRIAPGLYFNDMKSLLSYGMNPCDYEYTLEVISNLEKLRSGELLEYEWGGGERTWFISEQELTTAKDNFEKLKNIELPTVSVLEMMRIRRNLMEKWSKEDILELVSTSFRKIKNDKCRYVEDKEGCRYKVVGGEDDDLIVRLILLEEDFGLDDKQYLNQIRFNDVFFPPVHLTN